MVTSLQVSKYSHMMVRVRDSSFVIVADSYVMVMVGVGVTKKYFIIMIILYHSDIKE